MTFLAAVVTSPSYVAPLGAMIDAHARLGEVFATNPALGDYARMQTALRLFAAAGDRIELVGGRRIEPDAQLADAESRVSFSCPRSSLPTPMRSVRACPPSRRFTPGCVHGAAKGWRSGLRSEEHTSELQSLMRISYAVFCLKKTKKK